MSPRNRNRGGAAAVIMAATALDSASSLGPSPTAGTTGSTAWVHGPGRKLCQSFGECWMSDTFPFCNVTFEADTNELPGTRTLRVPVPSRYFCVGQVNE